MEHQKGHSGEKNVRGKLFFLKLAFLGETLHSLARIFAFSRKTFCDFGRLLSVYCLAGITDNPIRSQWSGF